MEAQWKLSSLGETSMAASIPAHSYRTPKKGPGNGVFLKAVLYQGNISEARVAGDSFSFS